MCGIERDPKETQSVAAGEVGTWGIAMPQIDSYCPNECIFINVMLLYYQFNINS